MPTAGTGAARPRAPACGTLEESAALAAQYSFGMIVQTVGHMEDEYDYETIENAGKEHAECFIKMMRKIKAMYPDVLGMGAGTCQRCKSCTYPDAPCRFPEDSYSSMEAYGLWVSKVCELVRTFGHPVQLRQEHHRIYELLFAEISSHFFF